MAEFVAGGGGGQYGGFRTQAEYDRAVAEKAAADALARQQLMAYQPTGVSGYGDFYYRAQQDPSLLRKFANESDEDALLRLKYNIMDAEQRLARRQALQDQMAVQNPQQTVGQFVVTDQTPPQLQTETSPFVTGGGSSGADRIQAIRDWWAANEGQGNQAALDRWLATSGYTAQEISQALPQFGVSDLEAAIANAIRNQTATPAPPAAPPQPSAPPPSAPPTPTVPARIQAIRDWWAANEGKGTQTDLNRWLATSGYSAREINQALPQFSIFDLQNAMRTAINDVAQQTPFAPAVPRAINEPYTSVAAQLAPTAASRQQEIQDWIAAYGGKGTQADLDRFLASGYTAQEIAQAMPEYPVGDLQRAIDAARQAYPTAAYEAALGRYQRGFQPGGQFVGNVSPYALVAQQMQQFQNPYADALANISMGGYTPSLYDVLLQDVVEQSGGGSAEPEIDSGIGPGVGGDSGIGGEGGGGEGGGGDGGGMSNSGEGGEGSPGGWAKGGLVDYVTGPNPPGPDDGIGMLQVGEYVIKKSSVDKYGKGLLDMINEGKIPAKKIKSLLD